MWVLVLYENCCELFCRKRETQVEKVAALVAGRCSVPGLVSRCAARVVFGNL